MADIPMNTKMDSGSRFLAYAMVFVLVVSAIIVFVVTNKAEGASQYLVGCTTSQERGTTTFAFITTTGASTTLQCEMSLADLADIDMSVVSSSSATVIHWSYEFSHLANPISPTDWYGEDTKTVIDNQRVSHGSATTTHEWTPNKAGRGGTTEATSTKNIGIPIVAAPKMRVNVSVSGANAAVNLFIIKREKQ